VDVALKTAARRSRMLPPMNVAKTWSARAGSGGAGASREAATAPPAGEAIMRGLMRAVLVVGVGVVATAQWAAADQTQPRLKKVAAPHVFSVDGATLFDAYCVSCHGRAAKGNGPAAPLLGTAVPDLTLIVARDGKFDERHVMFHVLRGGDPMPDWHRVLRANYNESDGYAHRAAVNLTRYIEALQVPVAPR
jgi:mono/diheme cytochrome c family protein